MPSWMWPTILAPFVGSFLGVVIRRLPAGEAMFAGRSRCPSCRQPIAPWDMVPLASYAWLRGRCRACGDRIGRFHPAVELAALAVPLSAGLVGIEPPWLWVGCGFGWALLALGWIDWECFRLPDELTLPLVLAGLIVTWRLAPDALADHALAAVSGYAGLRLLNAVYRALRGRDGLGQGDAKLLAAAGAWLGLLALPIVLWAAAVGGLAAAAVMRLRGSPVKLLTPVPFGACLALAMWLTWLYIGYM